MTGRQYFYHLEFELYKASEDTASPLMGDRSTFIPTASTDIFSFDLPGSLIICQAQHNSVISAPLSRNCKIGKSTKPNSTPQRPLIDCKSSSASQQRRSSRPNISAVTALRSLDVAKKDWRFGPITVESVLFEADKSMAQPQRTNSGDGKSNVTQARVEPLKLKIKGTKSTELGWGIVHLFREQEEAHGTHDVSSKRSATSDAHSESTDDMEQWDTTILCIPAVPSYMTASDFLGWVGEKTRAMVSHFRMVMTGKMNRYMMLMKFRDGEDARRWKSEWDSKVFNGMEPENCHVLFIRTIVFTTPGSASVARSEFPDISQDAFTPTVLSSAATSVAPRLDAKPLPPPTPALVELPTCPVCLERMDSEVSGLLTILCQHVFHCDCLQKWRGSGCPVCRHVQPSRSETAPFGVSMPSRDLNLCWQCDCSEDLWICLVSHAKLQFRK